MKTLVRFAIAVIVLASIAGAILYRYPLWLDDEQIRYHLWRSSVRSEYLEAAGHRLHYFEAFPPDGSTGQPLVLIHGLGSRGEDWSPMIPSLAVAGFHVYAPDLLGYGRSERPEVGYSISMEEDVVVAFLQKINLSHADIAGWSMGGWIAAKLTLDHPAMVDRLVLYDSVGIKFVPSFKQDAFVPTDTASLNHLLALLSPQPRVLPPFIVRASLRRVKSESRIVQRSMDSMVAGGDLLDTRLASIQQPTLIVWGMADTLIPPSVGQTMHRDIANSVFEGVTGCGHLAPGECPKPVLAGTIEFLKAEPPLPRGEKFLSGTSSGGEKPNSDAAR